MINEELILESVQTLFQQASKTTEVLSGFAFFLSKRFPGLSEKERAMFAENSATLLADAKAQQERIVKLEAALKGYRQAKKNA